MGTKKGDTLRSPLVRRISICVLKGFNTADTGSDEGAEAGWVRAQLSGLRQCFVCRRYCKLGEAVATPDLFGILEIGRSVPIFEHPRADRRRRAETFPEGVNADSTGSNDA